MDFVSPPSGPGMAPDVVNRAFDGNDVQPVLGERDLKTGVHRTELVGINEMPSTAIQEIAVFVHQALGARLHERDGAENGFGPIGVMNCNGQTARGKPEGNTRTSWGEPKVS